MPTAVQPQNCCETPRFPNVRQAARHFGFPNPDGAGAQAFRRWAQSIGATTVRAGNHFTYDLKQLEMLWRKQIETAA